MNILESIASGLASIWTHKLRPALTLFGIVVGVAAVVAMFSLVGGIAGRIWEDFDKLGFDNVLFVANTRHALALAHIGLAAGVALGGPYLGSWDGVNSHIAFASTLLWTLLLLRFSLTFPTSTRLGSSQVVTAILWGLWLLTLLLFVLELIFHPALYHTFGGPGALP